MLEVVALVLAVTALFAIYFQSRDFYDHSTRIATIKFELDAAKKRFSAGKISKDVFDSILEDLETELVEEELLIESSKRPTKREPKDLLFSSKPTKHQISRVSVLLGEIDLIRNEISILENKLLRRQISEKTYSKLVKKRHLKLLEKESVVSDLVGKKETKETK
jgi:hypothetical protein